MCVVISSLLVVLKLEYWISENCRWLKNITDPLHKRQEIWITITWAGSYRVGWSSELTFRLPAYHLEIVPVRCTCPSVHLEINASYASKVNMMYVCVGFSHTYSHHLQSTSPIYQQYIDVILEEENTENVGTAISKSMIKERKLSEKFKRTEQ